MTPIWLLFPLQTKINRFTSEIIVTTTFDVVSKWVKTAFRYLFSLETLYFIIILAWRSISLQKPRKKVKHGQLNNSFFKCIHLKVYKLDAFDYYLLIRFTHLITTTLVPHITMSPSTYKFHCITKLYKIN